MPTLTQSVPQPIDADWRRRILDRAQSFDQGHGSSHHARRVVAMLFAENSTRTRLSFLRAAELLGAQTLDFVGDGSSMAKGESLEDTARVLGSLGADVIVVRSSRDSAVADLEAAVNVEIVSAGEGTTAHPSQALLDIYTLEAEFRDLATRRIVVAGDIAHSRVARSLIPTLADIGTELTVTGPAQTLPENLPDWGGGITVAADMNDVDLSTADAVYLLRMQHERHAAEISLADYHERWGLTAARADELPEHAIVMHPGPVNRDVELASVVMDGPRSRIFQQVANGLTVRMAVLDDALSKGAL